MLPYAIMALGYVSAWATGYIVRKGKKNWIAHASHHHFLFTDWKTESYQAAVEVMNTSKQLLLRTLTLGR